MSRRIGVTGGRDYADILEVQSALTCNLEAGDVLIEGGARGADLLSRKAAEKLGIEVETHRAQWELRGKAAGFIRNQEPSHRLPRWTRYG